MCERERKRERKKVRERKERDTNELCNINKLNVCVCEMKRKRE